MPDYLTPEEDERQPEIVQTSAASLEAINRSEHAAMVATANLKENRRKLADFDSRLMAYASHSQEIALSMFYSLPRGGKQVIGASVRFAEIVAPCWRNCAVAARVIGDGQDTVTAQGVFIDYEANIRNAIEVPRRITDSKGNRYNADMIVVTSNAAMSVARRNAVLKGGVPQALWTPAYKEAQLTAVGKTASHAQRVASAIEYLTKKGVTEWQILCAVGVPSDRELETEHLLTLRVLCEEIRHGDKTIEEVFGSVHDKEITALFAQLQMNQAQQTMHRKNYMGRAEALVQYLRERAGAVIVGKPVDAMSGTPINTEPFKPDPLPNAQNIPYTVDEHGHSVKVEAAPQKEEMLPDLDAVVEQVAAQTEIAPEIASDLASIFPPTQERQQTTMEPPAKQRGRPSKAEQMRRAAAQQQGTLVSTETAVPETKQQIDDQFAF